MRKGIPQSVWGDEEGDPCICVWGMKGVPQSVWGDEEGGICVWGMRKGVPVSVCGG